MVGSIRGTESSSVRGRGDVAREAGRGKACIAFCPSKEFAPNPKNKGVMVKQGRDVTHICTFERAL